MVLSVSVNAGSGKINATCNTDDTCISLCCSNDKDYKTIGFCVAQDDSPRCTERRHRDIVMLLCFYAIVVPLIGLCAYLKVS
jgi:hypothetical protein